MELLLFSEAPADNFTETFREFFGVSHNGLSVAFIPNARDLSILEKRKHATENRKTIESFGFMVEEIDLLHTNTSTLKEKLMSKDILWMHGGYVSNLIQAIHTSGLHDNIHEILDSGVKYIGSSAGSMILGDSLDAAVWFPLEPDPAAQNLSGLGIVDFQIIPHFSEEMLPEIKKSMPKNEKYYLLADGQAIGVCDDILSFYGGEPRTMHT